MTSKFQTGDVVYYFELEPYNQEEIIFEIGQEFLDELLKKGICRIGKKGVSFNFVGASFYKSDTIFVLPKYLSKDLIGEERDRKIGEVLQIFRLYMNSTTKNLEEEFLVSDIETEYVSDFIVADNILTHYSKHGYYQKLDEEIVLNGNGIIEWEKTINEINPFFSKGRPYYLNTYNSIKVSDSNSIIREMHKWAVNFCNNKYGIILGYKNLPLENSVSDISQLGSEKFLLEILKREISQTYIDRDIQLLKSLITLITRISTFSRVNKLMLYGTRSFELVWEDICSFIFSNEVENFKSEIEKPTWINATDTSNFVKDNEKDTLKPDIIKTYTKDSNDYFIILDAKYYLTRYDGKNIFDNPGVNDIAKQQLYEKAFRHKGNKVFRNVFLFPKQNQKELFKPFGYAKLEFISTNPIHLIYVSVEKAYAMYLSRSSLSNKSLEEFIDMLNKHFEKYNNYLLEKKE